MGDRLVCICNMVSEKEIVAALKKGAVSTEDIQYATRAGTSCGKCLMTIDQLVQEHEVNAVPDPQQKLKF
ncbi:(2Fe-2S)-binding protein [uncultured Sunxiuqinia sp.]|uniref:(2Fe-2S)-binding protein n=1 Tax=Sunxiuqinia rutila TaxID=1397841 RepID=UPI00261E3A8E|nr:(2Fe-2S)-binding protein [uncultured Sunxiuqinia sp.]